jgi:hypothetical protein
MNFLQLSIKERLSPGVNMYVKNEISLLGLDFPFTFSGVSKNIAKRIALDDPFVWTEVLVQIKELIQNHKSEEKLEIYIL